MFLLLLDTAENPSRLLCINYPMLSALFFSFCFSYIIFSQDNYLSSPIILCYSVGKLWVPIRKGERFCLPLWDSLAGNMQACMASCLVGIRSNATGYSLEEAGRPTWAEGFRETIVVPEKLWAMTEASSEEEQLPWGDWESCWRMCTVLGVQCLWKEDFKSTECKMKSIPQLTVENSLE